MLYSHQWWHTSHTNFLFVLALVWNEWARFEQSSPAANSDLTQGKKKSLTKPATCGLSVRIKRTQLSVIITNRTIVRRKKTLPAHKDTLDAQINQVNPLKVLTPPLASSYPPPLLSTKKKKAATNRKLNHEMQLVEYYRPVGICSRCTGKVFTIFFFQKFLI